jgi:electron-transferring-flavoprotein dehydrogenase
VCAPATGCQQGRQTQVNFEPGVDLLAKVTVFGEAPRGLIREVARSWHFADSAMRVFETAVRVIEIGREPLLTSPFTVIHTFGYLGPRGWIPLPDEGKPGVLRLVVRLDYEDPMLEPYQEFLQFRSTR